MALDTFNPYLFVSSGEQSNKFLTPTYADGIAKFQAQRAQSLTGLTVRINLIQEGTGDPSPDNIRPISGRTGLTVTRAGKNLFDETQYQNLVTDYDYSQDSYHCKIIQLKPNTAYTISQRAGTADSSVILLLNTDRRVNNGGYFDCRANGGAKTFTTDESGNLYIGVSYSNDAAYNARLALCKIQIELGSTATAYEPYTGAYYPITWQTEAGTVYGGTLDVVSGVLTVDRKYEEFDGSTDENIVLYMSSVRNAFRIALAETCAAMTANKLLTNSIPYSPTSEGDGIGITCRITSYASKFFYVFAPPETASTVEEMRAYLSNQPLQLVYYIATPQTYRLTGAEVRTIAGFNQIYSDAGPVIDIKF